MVSSRSSGSLGSSYGAETPVKWSSSPACAARRAPSDVAAARSRAARHVDLDERCMRLDSDSRVVARASIRRDRGDDDGRAGAREPRSDARDAMDVDVAIGTREAEARGQERADHVAVEHVDEVAALLELRRDHVGDRRLPRRRQAREPDHAAGHVATCPSETAADGTVTIPHSTRPVPAQRPSRPLPGCVEWTSPIDS